MKINEYVSKYDIENQFDTLINTYKQIEFARDNKIDLSALKGAKFSSVVVSGLGGSAISADLMLNYLGDGIKIPFIVNRNYSLPAFAGSSTLVIISSYSGGTEETNAVFEEAVKAGCKVVAITTGGKVEQFAKANNVPVVKVIPGFQPRYSLGISFFSLLKVLQELEIIEAQDETVEKIIALWKRKGEEYSAEGNEAFKYAQQLIGYIPLIYSAADVTSAAGYRMKCQFNENSKLHAFHGVIPELNHNEIIGWESFSEDQMRIKLINLLDSSYHPQIKKRFEITSGLIAGKKAEVINLQSGESEFKLRLMDLVYLGDWITYYTAILRGFDPTEIDYINLLKNKLS